MGGPIPVLTEEAAETWVLARAAAHGPTLPIEEARGIVARVAAEGDAALLELTERLDGVRPASLRVPAGRIREAAGELDRARAAALETARRNLERVHAAQRRREEPVRVAPGVRAWREFRPIRRIGVYAPGGRAAYPSSLLMVAVPALVAGCEEIAVCSPPGPDGLPHASVLAAAGRLGLEEVYAVGGAQAVAALAHGTASVPRVDRVFGPGGAWVHAAKLAVVDAVAIDLPAGPSEVVVWADARTPAAWVAAELLAQAEHGPDSLCVGILPSEEAAALVAEELSGALERAARRRDAAASLADSALLVAADEARALGWIETLAPEHLALPRRDARRQAAAVRSAGSISVGPWTPVPAGDYAVGTNHVLPTGGRARSDGGLSLDHFGRWIQFQELEPAGLRSLAPVVETLAVWEGLPAHAEAVRARASETEEEDSEGVAPERGPQDGAGGLPCPQAPEPADREIHPAIRSLVRPHLPELRPYASARSRHLGGLLLDANENPFGPPHPDLEDDLHRYPHPRGEPLRSALAQRLGVPAERLWIGNGSDEILDLLVRVTAAPGEAVAVLEPGYGVYAGRARAHGARLVRVPLDEDFDLPEATARRVAGARTTFLCSPNNPTGNRLSAERILALAARAPGLVVVDEAYVEFAAGESLTPRAGDPPNLAVTRTFSKAWGLAGARVGYLVAHPDLVRLLSVAGLPYPVSRPGLRAATRALAEPEEVRRRRDRIVAERERLRAGIEGLGLRVLPSEANFLLFFVPEPKAVQRRLARDAGVVVRDRSDLPRLAGGLRVSVGTPRENTRFLRGLRAALDVGAEGPVAGAAAEGDG